MKKKQRPIAEQTPQERIGERTKNSRSFLHPDGSAERRFYRGDIYRKDEDGNWIAPGLQLREGVREHTFFGRNASFRARLGESGEGKGFLLLSGEDWQLELSALDGLSCIPKRHRAEQLRYDGLFAGVSCDCRLQTDRIKLSLAWQSEETDCLFGFRLRMCGLSLKQVRPGGRVKLCSAETDQTLLEFSPPTVRDAVGAVVDGLQSKLIPLEDGTALLFLCGSLRRGLQYPLRMEWSVAAPPSRPIVCFDDTARSADGTVELTQVGCPMQLRLPALPMARISSAYLHFRCIAHPIGAGIYALSLERTDEPAVCVELCLLRKGRADLRLEITAELMRPRGGEYRLRLLQFDGEHFVGADEAESAVLQIDDPEDLALSVFYV